MNLVRAILLHVETSSQGIPRIEGFDEDQVGYHVWLLGDAGLLETIETTHYGSAARSALPVSLTWEGPEFLDASRNEGTWKKAVTKVSLAGGSFTMAILKTVLESLIKSQLGF